MKTLIKCNLLIALNSNTSMFGLCLCELLARDWSMSTPELKVGSEVAECADHFTYLESLISSDGLVPDEISVRIR